jgi:hypothetical protein
MKTSLTIHTVKVAVGVVFMAPDSGRYCLETAFTAPLYGRDSLPAIH